jgi:hypothetical protein
MESCQLYSIYLLKCSFFIECLLSSKTRTKHGVIYIIFRQSERKLKFFSNKMAKLYHTLHTRSYTKHFLVCFQIFQFEYTLWCSYRVFQGKIHNLFPVQFEFPLSKFKSCFFEPYLHMILHSQFLMIYTAWKKCRSLSI